MDERDPFGRETSDDPLAEMGWSASGATEPDAGPADVVAPEQPDRAASRQQAVEPAPAPMPEDRPVLTAPSGEPRVSGGIPGQGRRARGLGCAFGIIVLAFIGAMAAVVVPAIIDAIDTVQEEIDDPFPGRDDPQGGDSGPSGSPPSGLQRRSLLRPENLAPALARLERVTRSSRVRLLRVDAERVFAQTVASGGRTRLAQATWEGNASVLSTAPGGGATSFPWTRVDPGAPSRIVRATTRGRRASSFGYLVLIDAAGLRWSAFLKGGRGFTASPDGRDVSRIGG